MDAGLLAPGRAGARQPFPEEYDAFLVLTDCEAGSSQASLWHSSVTATRPPRENPLDVFFTDLTPAKLGNRLIGKLQKPAVKPLKEGWPAPREPRQLRLPS